MQLIIDTQKDSKEELKKAAQFLLSLSGEQVVHDEMPEQKTASAFDTSAPILGNFFSDSVPNLGETKSSVVTGDESSKNLVFSMPSADSQLKIDESEQADYASEEDEEDFKNVELMEYTD